MAESRDFVLARLAVARAMASSSVAAMDEAISLFADPEEDPKGKERKGLIDTALDHASFACRALEAIDDGLKKVDWSAPEPWDEDERDDEDDE